jgi:hypothetical protein
VLLERERIAAKHPEISARHPGANCIEESEAQKTALAVLDRANRHDAAGGAYNREQIYGAPTPTRQL